jgi:hypothetical protein
LAIAAACILGLLVVPGYWFLVIREARHNAVDIWEEFSRDTAGASQKYKGRFVHLTGKVTVQTTGNNKSLVFEAPESAKWRIEFALKTAEMDKIKSGQEITVRCRLNPRKDEKANLKLSNCSIVEAR